MIYMVLLVAALVLVFLYEVPVMVKHKHWRDLVVFSVLSLSVFITSLLMLIKVNVPSPMRLVEAVVNAFMRLWGRP
ncbi:MAG: hypothetical protein ACOX34_01100 [Bacillota bacterium]|nr:hypothetical protein [Candidatus Fermentithermobacillaceae bacterium]